MITFDKTSGALSIDRPLTAEEADAVREFHAYAARFVVAMELVRELHQPQNVFTGMPRCAECKKLWPCATIKALVDGDE